MVICQLMGRRNYQCQPYCGCQWDDVSSVRPPGDWEYIPETAEEALQLILDAAYGRALTRQFNLSPRTMKALREIYTGDERIADADGCTGRLKRRDWK